MSAKTVLDLVDRKICAIAVLKPWKAILEPVDELERHVVHPYASLRKSPINLPTFWVSDTPRVEKPITE